jgi:DNA-binding MarR family transcriptional regulator
MRPRRPGQHGLLAGADGAGVCAANCRRGSDCGVRGPARLLAPRGPWRAGPVAYIVSSVNDIVTGRARGGAPGAEVDLAATAAAAELFTAISVIRRTARRATRQAWADQPLPPAQSELLRLAAARPGMTVADAAQELRLAPNTVSTLVGRLAEAGLLSREKSASDGRAVLLVATDKARRRLAEFRDLRAELAGRAIERMSAADQHALAAAAPALLRLAERMETP